MGEISPRVEWNPMRAFRKEDEEHLWFHDAVHNNPPISPMGSSVYHWPWGASWAAEEVSFPNSRGFSYVLYYGRIYPGVIQIKDEAEIRARARIFDEKIKERIDNFPKLYAQLVEEWKRNLEYLAGIDKSKLPLDKLLMVLKEAVRISKRNWALHFVMQYPGYLAYQNLVEICKKYGIEERDVRLLLQGFPTKMYEVDRALWRLVRRARELGIINYLIEEKPEELLSKLEKIENGRIWLNEFNNFLKLYGKRTQAAVFDVMYPTWLEDPMPVLNTLKTYALRGDYDFEALDRKIAEEREKAVQEVLKKIPEEEKAEFLKALKNAQNAYPMCTEDHNFYVEQWTYAELRYVILECGKRLAQYGILKDPNDVFFLTIYELYEVLEELIDDEKIGALHMTLRVRPLVEERKEVWKKLHDVSPPVVIGKVPETPVVDPIFIQTWGLTDEVIRGKVPLEVTDKLYGFPGSPGVAEGIARIILSYEEIDQVMPGDILVVPFTTPAWTPVFSKIKAVVTDAGGMLTHAAICAREYGIPAVVGTMTKGPRATKVIKTGQRIRVDGTNGVVEILK